MRCRALWIAVLLLAACERDLRRSRAMGEVDFEVSCKPAAQERVSEGVALLHHMLPAMAERSFVAAGAVDAACGMSHWGVAMSQIRPLYAEAPGTAAREKALAELERASASADLDDRERGYIEAASAYFRDGAEGWERAQRQLHEADPDDLDAAAFWAMAALSNASVEDRTHSRQKAVLEALAPLAAENPKHPGVVHALVHACDNAELASRGLDYAKTYEDIAPDLPTTAHTSSHIFVRLGLWNDVTRKNVVATGAAQRLAVGGTTPALYAHASDFLTYAYLQEGWDSRALKVIQQLQRVASWEDDFATAYGLAAVPARYLLERQDWEKAAALTPLPAGGLTWERYPAARAVIQFARGIGAARSENLAEARAAEAALAALAAEVEPAQSYWAKRIESQHRAVTAWIAYLEGDVDRALQAMREAADLEDAMDEDRVSPGPVLPLRELLGDMLHDADRPAEALQEFEASLAASPNRFYALYKAGRAAWKADDDAKARQYYWRVVRLVEASRSERPEVLKAKNHLRLLPDPEG